MQSLGAVTTAQILASTQKMLYKVEVYMGSTWYNVCSLGGISYLKNISIDLAGPGPTADPVAGRWMAVVDNKQAIFHPQNSASAYKALFQVGRKVRISIGGTFGGSDVYWQRIIGYMDTPRFNHSSRTVTLTGTDYCQDLIDTDLRSPDNYWGADTTITTTATTVTLDAELYDEADACEIGAGEANNVTNWTASPNASVLSVAEAGGGSTYVLKLVKGEAGSGSCTNLNVGTATEGTVYQVTFKYIREAANNAGQMACFIYETGTTNLMGSVAGLTSDDWATVTFQLTASASVAMQMTFGYLGGGFVVNDYFYIDEISIKAVTDAGYNISYALPDACNGPYYATLDGSPIYLGDPPESFGWAYSEDARAFGFVDGTVVPASASLKVYYYTDVAPETAVADILVTAGLYADQAAALAAMTYTATGVTIERMWFDAGTTCLAAIATICERCNYRFWFDYAGTPHFSPAPSETSPHFTFAGVSRISEEEMYQDLNEVHNSIVIEGMEQAMYGSTEKTQTSRLSGTTTDATSITAYREKVFSVTNHLFQDTASITSMLATLLAAHKDPKWYSDVTTMHNAAPLDLGDTIRYTIQLEAAYGWPLYGEVVYGEAAYASNGTQVSIDGLVRSINIADGQTKYICEATAA